MSDNHESVHTDLNGDDLAAEVKSDVAVVPKDEGKAMVAFHLEDGSGSLSCLLTQEQAAALSNALIIAADQARFLDASRPRRRGLGAMAKFSSARG
ncbi:hypothetical protein [uncultured Alsobacter sp.]|uniref:hypothetical protein n=1 Tax=uncultured Alsobacter sp. TaxID=1748258 RepID=UPI0025EC7897|nr:hypothetical protein [uncultured Alsobacter sp.]